MLCATVVLVASCSDDDQSNAGTTSSPKSRAIAGGDPVTTAPSTTTGDESQPAQQSTPSHRSGDCLFSRSVDVAFCDSFDGPNPDPSTRSGALDPDVWGVSRTNTANNLGQQQHNDWLPAHVVGCGSTAAALPPNDVRICDGKLFEAVNDGTGQSTLAMYPKQPFDIVGRTGTIVFDVTANSQGNHAAWPEFWWTDQPVPAPHGTSSSNTPFARNSFGFTMTGNCPDGYTGVGGIETTRDYVPTEVEFENQGCLITRGSADKLNHFEVRISETHVDIFGTDAGGGPLKLLAATDVSMPLTRGVIWIEDVHYNGGKFNDQGDHTFVWDKVGFDGPTPYRDLTFDVQDALVPKDSGLTSLGYLVEAKPRAVTAHGVHWLQTPKTAYVAFNLYSADLTFPDVRVNGATWHTTPWPFPDDFTNTVHTYAVPIPLEEIKPGDNTIEFRTPTSAVVVMNINIILIAAAPVP